MGCSGRHGHQQRREKPVTLDKGRTALLPASLRDIFVGPICKNDDGASAPANQWGFDPPLFN
jgi:hypothetical protein